MDKDRIYFFLMFKEEYFQKNSIICTSDKDVFLQVIEKPRRKWYHLLLEYITFGLYKANWGYKVKLIRKTYE